MSDDTYNIKEVIEIQFKAQANELKAITLLLKEQNINYDKRFSDIDKDIKELRQELELLKVENSRYKTVWGIGATVGVSFVA